MKLFFDDIKQVRINFSALMFSLLSILMVQAQIQAAPQKSVQVSPSSVFENATRLSATHQFVQAIQLLEKERQQASPDAKKRFDAAIAQTHAAWSQFLYERLNYEGALSHRLTALQLDPDSSAAFSQHYALAEIHYRLSEIDEALLAIRNALMAARQSKNRRAEVKSLILQGQLQRLQGLNGPALGTLRLALSIARAERADDLLLRALGDVALVQADLQQFTPALDKLSEALRLARQRKNKPEQAAALAQLGIVFSRKDELVDALRYLRAALTLYRSPEVNDPKGELETLHNLGVVYQQLRRRDEEMAIYSSALPLARALRDGRAEGYILEGIAEVFIRQSSPRHVLPRSQQTVILKQALPRLQRALLLKRQAGDEAGVGVTCYNLMQCYRLLGQHNLAIYYGKTAVESIERQRAGLETLPEEARYAFLSSLTDYYRTVADLLIEANRFYEAEQVLRLLKEQEYREAARAGKVALDSGAQVARDEREDVNNKRELELGGQVLRLARERARLQASGDDSKQLEAITQQLATANHNYTAFLAQLPVTFASTEQGKKVKDDIREFRENRNNLEASPGTVLLYTVVADWRYSVILFSAEGTVGFSYPIDSLDLTQRIIDFRMALQDARVDPRPQAKELYDILFCKGEVEKELKSYDAKTLVWSLDGALRLLPIGALSSDGKDYLVRRYASVVLTRQGIVNMQSPSNHWTALGFGASRETTVTAAKLGHGEHDLYFSQLPGVETELKDLIRQPGESTGLIQGTRNINDQFNRDSLLNIANTGTAFPLVHIASHFNCGITLEESFLVLGDGNFLTLAQLEEEGATAKPFKGVELLTLSACETAVAGTTTQTVGRNVDTLGGQMLTLGARAVLATLWPISDAGTPALMRQFYTLRAAGPAGAKAETLQTAQLALIDGTTSISKAAPDEVHNEPGRATPPQRPRGVLREGDKDNAKAPRFIPSPGAPYSHPRYWASFILMGNWQ